MNAVRMPAGLRVYRGASLKVGETTAVPEHMREGMREISSLETPPDERRKGYATHLMYSVTAEADRARMVLMILPDPYQYAPGADPSDRMSLTQLVSFYERFGFRTIQSAPLIMARQPTRSQIQHAVHQAMQ